MQSIKQNELTQCEQTHTCIDTMQNPTQRIKKNKSTQKNAETKSAYTMHKLKMQNVKCNLEI